ncbi:hypothetical protein L6R52_41865 [Myxococcota bacterium]|nr:hypothetical protein [Myxococcota bacterium]
MKNLAIALVSTVLTLTACGGASGPGASVDDKASAADAAYRLQNTNDGVRSRTGRGLAPAQALPGIGGDGSVSVDQTLTIEGETGTAELVEKVDVSSGDVSTEFTVKYHGFSLDGVNVLDGEITQRVLVSTSEGSASVKTELVGSIDVTGELTTSLVLDVSTEVEASGTSASVKLDGQIIADGVTYTYDGEAFDLSGQTL